MAHNITDFDNFIRTYISSQIKQKFPNLDISENGVFDDLHIKPAIENMQPLIDNTNTVDIMMDLSNAASMSEADLDAIGQNNYGLTRNSGSKASTPFAIYYTRVSDTDNTAIPSGEIFTATNGLQYQTTQKYLFTPAEMQARYDPSSMLYVATIQITAMEAGSAYNVPANQITGFSQTLSPFIESVTNLEAVMNGSDKESNTDYANRIQEFHTSRYVGSKPGYRSDITSLVTDITDVVIFGKGDALMERDEVTIVVGGTNKTIHIGGKSDIYVKGSKYEQRFVSLDIYSGRLKLSKKTSEINTGTVLVTNLTDTGKTVSFTFTNVDDTALIVINNAGGASYAVDSLSSIAVQYTTLGGTPQNITETFTCGLTQVAFDVPFNSIISVINSDDMTISYTGSSYQLIRKDIYGNTITEDSIYANSTQERTFIKFIDGSVIENGTNVLVTYTVNASVATLFNHYEEEKQRTTTTDILIREAWQHYVNIGFEVMMKEHQILDNTKKAQIQTAVTEYIEKLRIGEPLKESDIVSAIYESQTIMSYVSYIKLPFTAFYTPVNIGDPFENTHYDASCITPIGTKYIKLNKFIVTEVTA